MQTGNTDPVTREHLEALIRQESEPCVSMYIPTHTTGRQREEDPIQLKNVMRKAIERLVELDMREPDAKKLLAPVEELARDDMFWQELGEGLALFRSPDFWRYFRLPYQFDPEVVVNRHFYVKPLIQQLDSEQPYYLLALSQKQVRLYRGNQAGLQQVELEDLPQSVEEARGEIDKEQHLQYHSHPPGATSKGSKGEAVYHGQGAATGDTSKADLEFFCRKIDDTLRGEIGDQNLPLVVASVEFLAAIFEQASRYPHIVKKRVPGNPNTWSADDLWRMSWSLASELAEKRRHEAVERYWKAASQGRAINSLEEIVLASGDGAIDTLLIARGREQWGTVDLEYRKVQVEQGGRLNNKRRELLDLAAANTIINSGTVHLLGAGDIPGEREPAAAILRLPARQ